VAAAGSSDFLGNTGLGSEKLGPQAGQVDGRSSRDAARPCNTFDFPPG
jgi:hypothetical protein